MFMAYHRVRVLIRQEHILAFELITIHLLSIMKGDLCVFDCITNSHILLHTEVPSVCIVQSFTLYFS